MSAIAPVETYCSHGVQIKEEYLPPPVCVVDSSCRTPAVIPGDSLLSEPFVLENFLRNIFLSFIVDAGPLGIMKFCFPA